MTTIENNDSDIRKNLSWWIASLAVSLIICTGFAGYLFNIKADLANSRIRYDILEQRVDILSSQLQNMRRHEVVQQIQIAPPDGTIQIPTTVNVSPTSNGINIPMIAPTQSVMPPAIAPAAPTPSQEINNGHE